MIDIIDASKVTTSAGLQKLFDKFEGSGGQYNFAKKQKITVSEPMTMFSDMQVIGQEAEADKPVFYLADNVNPKLFEKQVPILAANGGKNVKLSGVSFFGNDTNQQNTPNWNGHTGAESPKQRGQGYHNFFSPQNIKNLVVDNVTVKKSLGDGVRAKAIEGGAFTRIKVIECGHDGLFLEESNNLTVEWCSFLIRANCGTRFRAVHNGTFRNNWIENTIFNGSSTGPGFQDENSKTTTTATKNTAYNNYFKNICGPGIWAIGTKNTSQSACTDLLITGNTFENCGCGGNNKNIAATGGICCDGWNGEISKNIFVNCKGSAVNIGPWVTAATAGRDYRILVIDNILAGTEKGNRVFKTAGTALNKTTARPTTVTHRSNVFWDNPTNAYCVVADTEKFNPRLEVINGLYVVGAKSPCQGRGIGAKDVWSNPAQNDPEVILQMAKVRMLQYQDLSSVIEGVESVTRVYARRP